MDLEKSVRNCCYVVVKARPVLNWAVDACRPGKGREQMGFMFVRPLGETGRFACCEFIPVPDNRLLRQARDAITSDPLCLIWACRHAKETGTVLFMVHTHVAVTAAFSELDDKTERRVARCVMELTGVERFGAVVLSLKEHRARLWQSCGDDLVQTAVTLEA